MCSHRHSCYSIVCYTTTGMHSGTCIAMIQLYGRTMGDMPIYLNFEDSGIQELVYHIEIFSDIFN